jgi:ABC-type nickel/cobalt efflux system permease component RcnA
VFFLAVGLFCAAGGILDAHPLGNFTINRLTKLAVTPQRVTVRYFVDMAEIPTYQAMRATRSAGVFSEAELQAWAKREAADDAAQLVLAIEGTARTLQIDDVRGTIRSGAGGLPTLYLMFQAHSELPRAPVRSLTYRDNAYSGRLGWRDVVVAPAAEPTHELTVYPNALVGSLRATNAVEVALDANGRAVVRAEAPLESTADGLPSAAQTRSNQLSDMLARGSGDWRVVWLTLLVALALGALHALEPGHGKTLLAITLVGARATAKQATILALALTVAHTIGVLALGVALNLFKGVFVPEAIYPWITFGSGIVIAIIGARAVQQLVRRGVSPHDAHTQFAHPHEHVQPDDLAGAPGVHDHGSGPHSHSHDHDHDTAHAHAHAIRGTAPLRFGSTVWAAMSGGIAPCPAALVVLLAAIALNQVAYGIFVIVAFSFGLAVTLTGLGIAVVRGADWLSSRPQFEGLIRFGPFASAFSISTIGALMVGQGFAVQSAAARIAITALVALAIAGYALSHPFQHGREEAA